VIHVTVISDSVFNTHTHTHTFHHCRIRKRAFLFAQVGITSATKLLD